MRVAIFDYELPEEQIAQRPTEERERARMLVLGEGLSHARIADLPERLPARALLVVNDTRVRRARLIGKKASGGRVEIFLLGPTSSGTWCALGRSSKPLRVPSEIEVSAELSVRLVGRNADGTLEVALEARATTVERAIETHGRMPLPPYIRRDAEPEDDDRYQTVYAEKLGAVAAPTAGLHLSAALLDRLRARGHEIAAVTLHVGLGTFQPVVAEDLDQHAMHAESFEVPESTAGAIERARREGRPVVAIGTTVVRALESAALGTTGETRLLIQPGFEFRAVDALLTNFHLPRSTLLALVCAFGGTSRVLEAYRVAVREGYRFYSYGDAMLILR